MTVHLRQRRSPVIRVSLPWLVNMVDGLDALDGLVAGKTLVEVAHLLFPVQTSLETIFNSSIYGSHLRTCRESGTFLHSVIQRFTGSDGDWSKKTITEFDVYSVKEAKTDFKRVVLAEMSVIPTYLVTKKDVFDVNLLVEEGTTLFPAGLRAKVPEIEKDANEAGKALAFELSTACGFHVFRILESVVRRYWDKVSEGKPRPGLETLGNFAAEMERNKFGDQKVVEAVKQMNKLHRNPLIHPEVILTLEEAIGIVGMARSVIGAMLQVLPDAPVTTGAAPAVAAPA